MGTAPATSDTLRTARYSSTTFTVIAIEAAARKVADEIAALVAERTWPYAG